MFSKVFSADICGVDAYPICVEADVSGGGTDLLCDESMWEDKE